MPQPWFGPPRRAGGVPEGVPSPLPRQCPVALDRRCHQGVPIYPSHHPSGFPGPVSTGDSTSAHLGIDNGLESLKLNFDFLLEF